jgi:hypothetical protein
MSEKNSGTLAIGWTALSPFDCEFPGFPPDEPDGPIDPDPIDPGPIDPGPIDPGPVDLILPGGCFPPLPDFPPGGIPLGGPPPPPEDELEDELCAPTVSANCCLTEPLPVFWVCSQYSGPYPGGYDYGGWVKYGGGLASAWNPPPPLQAKSFCSCSPRFIYTDDSVVLVPLALSL